MIKFSYGVSIFSRPILNKFYLPRMYTRKLEYYPPDHWDDYYKPTLGDRLKIKKEPGEELSVYEEKVRICDTIIQRYEMKCDLWEKAHETYYGKQRDMVNFPPASMPDYHPKIRLGFIPDAWFDAFYNKTGVTGPYVLLFNGFAFLLQKEYLVCDPDFAYGPYMFFVCWFLVRLFGPMFTEHSINLKKKSSWFYDIRPKDIIKKLGNKSIEVAKIEKASADVNVDLFQAAKENVSLQLENVYRKRNLELYRAVKSRLDYFKDKELVKQRFQRSYMINWIVDSVVKDFTPEQEKATLNQCITDLKILAKKQNTTFV